MRDPSTLIEKILVLSTAHISRATAERLETNEIEGIYARQNDEYGWFIPLVDLDEVERAAVPYELLACLNLAREHDCAWLLLDESGETVPLLDRFDW